MSEHDDTRRQSRFGDGHCGGDACCRDEACGCRCERCADASKAVEEEARDAGAPTAGESNELDLCPCCQNKGGCLCLVTLDDVDQLRAALAKATGALEGIDTFAWSALYPDCKEAGEEVMRRITACRAALAALREVKP